jgi:hypothetical protein
MPGRSPTTGSRLRAKDDVVRQMTDYLPDGELQFLVELSIEPVAAKLGLIAT